MIESHDTTESMATLLTPADASPAGPSAGALLRKAREDAGMHLGMLSVALKVPVRNLMALEADQHALLSGPVFVRALANSVCRKLQIDATPVLALLPPASNRLELLHPGLASTSSEDVSVWLRRHWQAHRQGSSLALGLLLLIALVVWWPEYHAPITTASPQAQEAPPDTAQASPATPPTVVMLPSDGALAVSAPISNVQSATPEVAAEALPAKATPVESSSLPADSGLLLIGKSESWVQVKNTTGQLVFNQLVKPGDRHVLEIEGTMNVVIGFADGVQVQLRGKPLDLTPFSKGAVARFEVK